MIGGAILIITGIAVATSPLCSSRSARCRSFGHHCRAYSRPWPSSPVQWTAVCLRIQALFDAGYLGAEPICSVHDEERSLR